MHDTASSDLTAWSNFYVITGSSAGALTGLVFVVITLVAGARARATSREGIGTYTTPTVVHFSVALLISAILSAPWRSLTNPGIMLGLTGLYGVVYTLLVIHRTRRLTGYSAQLEDWIWYTVLPLIAYVAIVAAAIRLPIGPTGALFTLAGATALLIFVGIHNAWDVVTFIAIEQLQERDASVTPSAAAPTPSSTGSDEPPPAI